MFGNRSRHMTGQGTWLVCCHLLELLIWFVCSIADQSWWQYLFLDLSTSIYAPSNGFDSHRSRAAWRFSGFDIFKKKTETFRAFERDQFPFSSRIGMMHGRTSWRRPLHGTGTRQKSILLRHSPLYGCTYSDFPFIFHLPDIQVYFTRLPRCFGLLSSTCSSILVINIFLSDSDYKLELPVSFKWNVRYYSPH